MGWVIFGVVAFLVGIALLLLFCALQGASDPEKEKEKLNERQ